MLSLSAWIDQQGWDQCVLPSSQQFPPFPSFSTLEGVVSSPPQMPGNAWTPSCPSPSQPGAVPGALSCQRDHRPPGTSPGSARQQFRVPWTFPAQDHGMDFHGAWSIFVFCLPQTYSTFGCFLGCFQLPLSYPQNPPCAWGGSRVCCGMGFSSLVGKAQPFWENWGQEQSGGLPADPHGLNQRGQDQLLWGPTVLHIPQVPSIHPQHSREASTSRAQFT